MNEDVILEAGTGDDPAKYLTQCSATREAADSSGVDLSLRLTTAMADFYVLERLEADGSRTASKLLGIHERYLAPRLSRYMSMICGGELRHVCMRDEEAANMSCGCHCQDCHESDECSDRRAYELPGVDEDEWRYQVPDCIAAFVDDTSNMSGRNDAWTCWMSHQDSGGPAMINHMALAFENQRIFAWQGGGYGGEAWGSIASLCYDYESGKLAPRHFINMAWSLQHNGGSMFNKLWHSDHLATLMDMLESQAEDSYARLARYATTPTRDLWRHRDLYRFSLDDHDSIWLGTQVMRDPEVTW